ncbi:hypothetical protein MNB_SV-15-1416 [hydrothermal vent metagenome]|uniref:DUF2279 domain-containing protein n=1 Tax=hydrothermal vent metagenome TaxID=652676 RepID=A0A1W1EI47_9ZZZZ
MKKIILPIIISLNLMGNVNDGVNKSWSETILLKPTKPLSDEELKDRIIYTQLAGAGLVALWGTAFWDYFTIKPVIKNEGWFGKDTKYGGADKLGHLYSTYLWSYGFSSLYQYWGMESDDAILYASLSSWSLQGLMEFGDSFSKSQGFSYEDFIMNTVGAGFYYLREKYPQIKDRVDLKLEYMPDFNSNVDFFTQYNSMKYFVSFKFSGFESTKDTPLKYFDVDLGYYTRGYSQSEDYRYEDRERVAYIGISVNLSKIFSDNGYEKIGEVFHYYQPPYTSIPFGYDMDSNSYVKPYSRGYFGDKK